MTQVHQRQDEGLQVLRELGGSSKWAAPPDSPGASCWATLIWRSEPPGPRSPTCCPEVFSGPPWLFPLRAPSSLSEDSSLLSLPESSRPENTLSSLSERPEPLPSSRLGVGLQSREGCKKHRADDGQTHSPPAGVAHWATRIHSWVAGWPPRPQPSGHKPPANPATQPTFLTIHLHQQHGRLPLKGTFNSQYLTREGLSRTMSPS